MFFLIADQGCKRDNSLWRETKLRTNDRKAGHKKIKKPETLDVTEGAELWTNHGGDEDPI